MSEKAAAKLVLRTRPDLSSIEINGLDLTSACVSLNLYASSRGEPHLLLDLLLLDCTVEGEVAVSVPDRSHQALVALGWTPPAEGGDD